MRTLPANCRRPARAGRPCAKATACNRKSRPPHCSPIVSNTSRIWSARLTSSGIAIAGFSCSSSGSTYGNARSDCQVTASSAPSRERRAHIPRRCSARSPNRRRFLFCLRAAACQRQARAARARRHSSSRNLGSYFSPGETVKRPIGLSAANHCIDGCITSDQSSDIVLIFIKIAFESDNYDGMFQ